jgi:hypothetical protein
MPFPVRGLKAGDVASQRIEGFGHRLATLESTHEGESALVKRIALDLRGRRHSV